jgi:prophage tail gpP-like protein
MPDVRLRVGGREFGGWQSARVTRGIECIAGSFELSVSDRWGGQDTPWPIAAEDECVLLLEGEAVITGYVDRRSVSYNATAHDLTVAGRDAAGALVDCSAYVGKWEFLNVPLLTFARKLCEPFGIPVTLQPGLALPAPLAKLSINPGDSAFAALETACRLAGVLPVSYGAGAVMLTRAGSSRATAALVEGQNILSASADYDATGRFRRYVVVGQHQGTDEVAGASAASVKGEAQDLGVRRGARVLLVQPEGGVTPKYAKTRAEWDAKVRAARGDAVTVAVQGWRQADGALWPVNALVPVRSPYLGIDGEMLITQATYGIDGSTGTTTALTLRRPDAFLPEPVIAKSAEKRWKELA